MIKDKDIGIHAVVNKLYSDHVFKLAITRIKSLYLKLIEHVDIITILHKE